MISSFGLSALLSPYSQIENAIGPNAHCSYLQMLVDLKIGTAVIQVFQYRVEQVINIICFHALNGISAE